MKPMHVLSVNESDLPLAMEQNLAEHACHLHRTLKGASVTETGDLLIADSGLDDDTFNIVARARFIPGTAPARAAETARTLAATGRPFSWWVGPASTPDNLAEHLQAAGLEASETEAGMWKDLRDPLPDAHVDGLEILPATTPEQLADYATVLAANWHPPAATVRRFFADTAGAALTADCPAATWSATSTAVPSARPRSSCTRASPASTTSPHSPPTAAAAMAGPSPRPPCTPPGTRATRPRCCRHPSTENLSTGASVSPSAATSPSTPSPPDPSRQPPALVIRLRA